MAKKSSTQKMCDCLRKVNKKLAEAGENTRIAGCHSINFSTGKTTTYMELKTEKADPKKPVRLRRVIPTYCPVCGKKYPGR